MTLEEAAILKLKETIFLLQKKNEELTEENEQLKLQINGTKERSTRVKKQTL